MKDIIIDFSTRQVVNGNIEATQGDNTTKKVKILLKNNSTAYNLTSKTIQMAMKKNNSNFGEFLTPTITNATNGEIELNIDKNFTKEKGSFQLQLTILNGDLFEENSVLFEAIIHTNLRDEISDILVESSSFKEIKQTLEQVKDIAKNEQARQDYMENVVRPEVAKIQKFDSRINENEKNIIKNTKDITKAFDAINFNSFLPFEGEEVTIEHSKIGYTQSMNIKGATFQNLLDYKSIEDFNQPFNATLGENEIIRVEATGTEKFIFLKKKDGDFKPNSKYTVIFEVISNTVNLGGKVFLFGGGGCFKEEQTADLTTKAFHVTTVDDFTQKQHLIDMFFTSSCKSGTIKFRIYILKGHQRYIPPYFNGIESAGEKESIIQILSSGGTKGSNIEIQLPFEGGLMGINNFKDEISEESDGIYVIKKIIKQPYQVGDENLENCLTDKINSYKVKEVPIKYKISKLNSINLETFSENTIITSNNKIKPQLKFNAPVNIPATISHLKNVNSILLNQNAELVATNKKQNEALKDISNTTDFLIEDALTRNLK